MLFGSKGWLLRSVPELVVESVLLVGVGVKFLNAELWLTEG